MPRASPRRFRRLLVGSGGPRRRCSRRRKSCVRIRKGSAFSARDSMRQTAGLGGRAAKKSSSRAGSNSRPQSSSSTVTGYTGTGEPTADSSQPTARRGRRLTVDSGKLKGRQNFGGGAGEATAKGLSGLRARVEFNAEFTEFAEGDGGTPPRVFFVRVANTGLRLDAASRASRIVTRGDRGAVGLRR